MPSSGPRESAEERHGVLGAAVAENLEMEVGGGNAARSAGEGNDRSPREQLAGVHVEFREVRVERAGTAGVLDDDDVPVAGHGAREVDPAGCHGADGCAHGERDVHTVMDAEIQPVASQSEG